MKKSMSTKLRPFSTTFLGLASATLLAGCASLGSTAPETVTVTESAPSAGSEAQRGGDEDSQPQSQPETQSAATFDRNSPDFEFFNICEELTDEDLADVGLIIDDESPLIDLSVPMSNCGFSELDGFDTANYGIQYAVMSMGAISEDEFTSSVTFHDEFDNSTVPGIRFFYPNGEFSERSCDVAVPTENGRLWVSYGTVREGAMTHREICSISAEYLLKILSVMEKKNEFET